MAVLDFREIPKANTGKGDQDTFELFARDFLQYLGYKIISNPDRGADGGKDMIVEENINGISKSYKIKWLVSCKHFAHSKKSVSCKDEIDIKDRVLLHNCDGFMGIYSTLPSSGLNEKIHNLGIKFDIFDCAKIESFLVKNKEIADLARRYFPKSYEQYRKEHPIPVKIFKDGCSIKCECCGQELLDDKMNGRGIFCLTQDSTTYRYNNVYTTCKGVCDENLAKKYGNSIHQEIDYLKNPIGWLNQVYTLLIDNDNYEDIAQQKLRDIFLNAYPYVIRELTTEEKEQKYY